MKSSLKIKRKRKNNLHFPCQAKIVTQILTAFGRRVERENSGGRRRAGGASLGVIVECGVCGTFQPWRARWPSAFSVFVRPPVVSCPYLSSVLWCGSRCDIPGIYRTRPGWSNRGLTKHTLEPCKESFYYFSSLFAPSALFFTYSLARSSLFLSLSLCRLKRQKEKERERALRKRIARLHPATATTSFDRLLLRDTVREWYAPSIPA